MEVLGVSGEGTWRDQLQGITLVRVALVDPGTLVKVLASYRRRGLLKPGADTTDEKRDRCIKLSNDIIARQDEDAWQSRFPNHQF